MADVITRFKLETTQYDSALRDASMALSNYSKKAELAGKDFDKYTQSQVEAARALGDIATSATNTKDKVGELVSAYNNVARAYNNLTEEQKKSDFGRAMAESLNTLQGRIKDVKSEMNSAPGMLDKFAEKFTVNVDAIKLFNIGLKAAEGVLNVAKDAFFASEANVDEWGRTMASAQSLYEGFVTSLNNSDFSGFLTRIDDIVEAARKAYNELDLLGTMKTIQTPQISSQRTENERTRLMIQTGRYIAPLDGRKNATFNGKVMQNGDLLTPGQIRYLENQLKWGTQKMVTLVGNEVKQTGKAIDAYYDSIAKQNGMSLQEFKKGTSTWDEFQVKLQGYENYRKWDAQARTEFAKQGGRGYVDFDKNNPYAEYRKWGTFRVDKMGENSFNDLVRLIQQRDQQASQAYSTQSMAYRTINRAEGISTRKLLEGGGSGGDKGGGATKTEVEAVSGSIDEQTKLVQGLQKAWRAAADDDSREKIKEELEEQQYILDRMTGKEKFDQTKIGQIADLTGRVPTVDLIAGVEFNLPDVDLSAMSVMLNERLRAALDADKSTLKVLMQDAIQNGIDTMDLQLGMLNEKIARGVDVPDEAWQKIIDQYNEIRKKIGKEPIEVELKSGRKKEGGNNSKTVNELNKINGDISKMTSGVSSIVSGIQSLGVKIPEEIQGVVGMLSGVSSILSGITALLSLIHIDTKATAVASATDAIIPFARGGVVRAAVGYEVPGNHFSGDMVPALLNSGETVLNRAQQGNLVSQLEGANGRSVNVKGVLQGEQIFLAAERWSKRTGKGEIVTW